MFYQALTQRQVDTAVFLETTRFTYLAQMAQKHLGGNSPLPFYASRRVLGHLSLYETAALEDSVSPLYMKDATTPASHLQPGQLSSIKG